MAAAYDASNRKRMSMAHDNTIRPLRANDPQQSATQPSGAGGQASDPLMELARLIGQTDPFNDPGRSGTRAGARAPGAMTEPHVAPVEPGFARHDPYRMASAVGEPLDPQSDSGLASAYHQREPQFAGTQPMPARQAHPTRAAPANDLRAPQPYFEDGVPMTPHDEATYDDPPPARRRGGFITAVTLIGCAMIGTAGAYSYRTYYVVPSASKTPPVITAEAAPSKIIPADDNQATKMGQDGLRPPVRGEQIVSREEQPVELRDPPAVTSPRVVLPAPVQPSRSTFPPSANVTQSGSSGLSTAVVPTPPAPPAGGANEPKRVRTVTIRPDGADLSGRPVGNFASAGDSASAGAAGRGTPAAKSTAPARNAGPLSLDPQASTSAQPASGQRDRFAAAPPTATQAPSAQAAPPRLASAPSSGAGSYLVQLSSQRSEAEAQASYRSLQAKFPSQLGGQSPIIKRVDLGAKGVYYRAMIGPFASSGEADQFCSGLKAAGGQCLIQRN
jgi:hypothetical protein